MKGSLLVLVLALLGLSACGADGPPVAPAAPGARVTGAARAGVVFGS
ncbi:MAG: hypothetical protein IT545_07945 [Rhodobacteraceae bacterium]|nr:hypothetical protein [Paracoccaceae bacterium]